MAVPDQNKPITEKVTAGGSRYVEYEILVPSTNDLLLVLVPQGVVSGERIRSAGFSHGRGATRTQINSGAHVPFRDALLEAGYLVWSGDYGFNAWSSRGAVEKMTAAQAWVDSQWTITHRFLIGESMGGSLVGYVAAKKPFKVDGFFFIFPSVSLRKAWARDQWSYRDEMVLHFGIQPNGSDFNAVTAAYDPFEFPASDYAGAKAKIYSGTNDAIVSYGEVVQPWFEKLASVSDEVTLTATPTGHGDAANLPPVVIREWFDSLSVAPEEPPPYSGASLDAQVHAWNGSEWIGATPKQYTESGWTAVTPKVLS